jgi:hypothetical protein
MENDGNRILINRTLQLTFLNSDIDIVVDNEYEWLLPINRTLELSFLNSDIDIVVDNEYEWLLPMVRLVDMNTLYQLWRVNDTRAWIINLPLCIKQSNNLVYTMASKMMPRIVSHFVS